MKTKKFNFNWQSVLLGMVLCMVLVAFVGSKAASAQTGTVQGTTQVLQRPATIADVWDKTNAMNEQLNRIEQKIDNMNKDLARVLRAIH